MCQSIIKSTKNQKSWFYILVYIDENKSWYAKMLITWNPRGVSKLQVKQLNCRPCSLGHGLRHQNCGLIIGFIKEKKKKMNCVVSSPPSISFPKYWMNRNIPQFNWSSKLLKKKNVNIRNHHSKSIFLNDLRLQFL